MDEIYVKITLLGDTGCGKSSIVKRLMFKEQKICSFAAVGANFSSCVLKIDGTNIKLCIWDPSGHEKYNKLCKRIPNMDAIVSFIVKKEVSFAISII